MRILLRALAANLVCLDGLGRVSPLRPQEDFFVTERKPLSKKARFQVFKRDEFKCCYCGRCPPNIVLEVDHIIAVANGGTNQVDNLITSCFDCNRGKGAERLEAVPQSLSDKIAIQQEKMEQIKALDRLLKQQKKRESAQVDEIERVFKMTWAERQFADRFRLSVTEFIQEIGVDECIRAMNRACGKARSPEDCLKYFCGICWNKVRDRNHGQG